MTAVVLPCLFFALSGTVAVAQEASSQGRYAFDPRQAFSPFSIAGEDRQSVTRDPESTLHLQLDQPFSLQQFGQVVLGQSGKSRVAGAALDYRLADDLGLQAGMSLGANPGAFHALGSIHCQNGVLDALSYRASDCTFIDDRAGGTARSIVIGAAWDTSANTRASVNLFSDQNRFDRPLGSGAGSGVFLDPFGTRAYDQGLLGGLSPMLSGYGSAESERTGVDVEFQVGFSTDMAGDLVLGLQLTRVLDSGTEGVFYTNPGARNWTIAKPYDTARLSLDWARGSFSGGLDSYYRSPVSFLDQGNLDSQATFDVHFTWRAPWNASVSVGASNVLGAGTEDTPATDTSLADPFESIYGRIPYVRYKQDL